MYKKLLKWFDLLSGLTIILGIIVALSSYDTQESLAESAFNYYQKPSWALAKMFLLFIKITEWGYMIKPIMIATATGAFGLLVLMMAQFPDDFKQSVVNALKEKEYQNLIFVILGVILFFILISY